MDRPGRVKGVAFGLLFLLLVVVTFAFLLRGQDPAQFRAALSQVNLPWLGVGAACMAGFLCCEGKNIQLGLSMFGSPAPYKACLRYAITGFFFSSVTPSASGGQPMQLYAMHRDGHSTAAGALALLTEFFSFQVTAVLLACLGFFLRREVLLSLDHTLFLCFLLGVSLNLLLAAGLCFAVFSRRALPFLWKKLMKLSGRLFPKQTAQWDAWGQNQWKDLQQCTRCYRTHKRQLAKMLLISLVQLTAYHSIPFLVYTAFGLSGQNLLSMLGLQAVLFVSVSALPLPGAVGLSEGGFLALYRTLFPAAILPGAMLLSRGISFYLFLLLSGLFLAIRSFTRTGKQPVHLLPPAA